MAACWPIGYRGSHSGTVRLLVLGCNPIEFLEGALDGQHQYSRLWKSGCVSHSNQWTMKTHRETKTNELTN